MLLPSMRSSTRCMRTAASYVSASSRRQFHSLLISPAQLNAEVQKKARDQRIIPLCASWFLPNDGRTGIETFKACRIPGARFFDLDAVKDPKSPYPHMLPSQKDFAEAMGGLGIRSDDDVVVYDSKELGIFSAPRVAFTLQVLGHRGGVHILNNYRLWVNEGYPTTSGEPESVQAKKYDPGEANLSKVIGFEEVRDIAETMKTEQDAKWQIVDMRSSGRFIGTDPEPRKGISSGHIPHSISVPFSELLDPVNRTFLAKDQLREVFKSKGIDGSKPIIGTCGTGVNAAILEAALAEVMPSRKDDNVVYDGSWTEWAQRVKPDEDLIWTSEGK